MSEHVAGLRALLALVAGCTALGAGVSTAFVQAENYDLAARLDALQQESEWNERCATVVRSRIEQFAFDLAAHDDRERASRAPRTTDRGATR